MSQGERCRRNATVWVLVRLARAVAPTRTRLPSPGAILWHRSSQIIWVKDRFAPSRHYHWQNEPWYGVRNGSARSSGNRKQSTPWQIPARERAPLRARHAEAGRVHASANREQFIPRPGGLRAVLGIRDHDHRGRDTGRSCHAIELLGQYVDVAVERWQAFTGDTARLERDGKTFAAVDGRAPGARPAPACAAAEGKQEAEVSGCPPDLMRGELLLGQTRGVPGQSPRCRRRRLLHWRRWSPSVRR